MNDEDGDGYAGAFAVMDEGAGTALFAAGRFVEIDGSSAMNLARYDGHGWSEVGGGVTVDHPNDWIESLEIFNDGTGPALFVGGEINLAGDLPVSGIARWDSEQWSDVAGGVGDPPYGVPYVRDMAVFDDGQGPALYCSGWFGSAGSEPANHIAKWDGQRWWGLGEGNDFEFGTHVGEMGVFDDGTGPSLFIGGLFSKVGGVPARGLARFDGQQWHAMGTGLHYPGTPYAQCFEVFDDGSGPALYVGGRFTDAGGVPGTQNIARWDGKEWSSVGGGVELVQGWGTQIVLTLKVFDDGRGPALYAGGEFLKIGGTLATYIARWDGTKWTDLSSLMDHNWVSALQPYSDGEHPTLWVAGGFHSVDGQECNGLARYSCIPSPCPGDCDGNGQFEAIDFLCFTQQFNNQDPAADLDHSTGYGQFDIFDYLAFINGFNNGCP